MAVSLAKAQVSSVTISGMIKNKTAKSAIPYVNVVVKNELNDDQNNAEIPFSPNIVLNAGFNVHTVSGLVLKVSMAFINSLKRGSSDFWVMPSCWYIISVLFHGLLHCSQAKGWDAEIARIRGGGAPQHVDMPSADSYTTVWKTRRSLAGC